MKRLIDYLVLPRAITPFEIRYLEKLNRIALGFFALHVPAMILLAWANGTGPWLAAVLAMGALAGPAIAYRALERHRAVSLVHGVAAMFFGALLVHFGQGPMQIEMHFYFFALIAMLAVFGNPMVIIVAAVTVALHHLALWFLLPRSVFNYEAPIWVVAVHAAFVILESVAGVYIARSFFDNVIGLERIVQSRTVELDGRNRDLRLVLDNVDQGFVTMDRSGALCGQRSRTFDHWFSMAQSTTLADILRPHAPEFATALDIGWGQLLDDVLPLELVLDQLPKSFTVGNIHYGVRYLPIDSCGAGEKYLVVFTDVTSQVNRDRTESERREVLHLLERVVSDRAAVQTYFDDANALIDGIAHDATPDLVLFKRRVHTLKGNSAIFGLETVASLCHDLETRILEEGEMPAPSTIARLAERWSVVCDSLERIIGSRRGVIELESEEHACLELEAARVSESLYAKIHALKLEPTKRRLEHFAEQARRIAQRLDKDVTTVVEDAGLRVDPNQWAPFWSAFVHAIRNAVDHGIEGPAERTQAGKPEIGELVLRTTVDRECFAIEVQDDGRGIDWDRIRAAATTPALAVALAGDLETAIFRDGVSTATEVTDISGRGLGMGALLEATKKLGGAVTIESVAGRGTTIRMIFPLSSTSTAFAGAPAPQPRAA